MMTRLTLTIALAAALVLLTACGGGTGSACVDDGQVWTIAPTLGGGPVPLPRVGDDGGDSAGCAAIARR
jgi:hypothetical protein